MPQGSLEWMFSGLGGFGDGMGGRVGWGYAIPKSLLSQPVRVTTQVHGGAVVCPPTSTEAPKPS